MTVQSTTNRHDYVATAGQTVFPYAFRIFADTELKVYQAGVLKDLTTHYTVSGVDNAYGGNVTLVTGATAGDAIAILRDVDATQLTDWVEAGPTPADSFEDAVDKLTMLAQEHEEIFGRTFQMPESSVAGSPILPTPEIGKFLRWDGTTPPEIGNADLVALGLLGFPVSQVNGGTGQDTSALSGQPELRAGTWYFPQNHVNVKTYGAIGNGVTDDTAAIQAAADAAVGSILYFPAGTYIVDNFDIGSGTTIQGAGPGATILKCTRATGANFLGVIHNTDPVGGNTDITIRDLQIWRSVEVASVFDEHLYFKRCARVKIERVRCIGTRTLSSGTAGKGILLMGCTDSVVTDCNFIDIPDNAVGFNGDDSTTDFDEGRNIAARNHVSRTGALDTGHSDFIVTQHDCRILNNYAKGMGATYGALLETRYLPSAGNLNIRGLVVQDNTADTLWYGLLISNTTGATITNNHLRDSIIYVISVGGLGDDSRNLLIRGNTLDGSGIKIENCNRVTVSENISYNAPAWGIYLAGDVSHPTVINNQIYEADSSGIVVYTTTPALISHNTVVNSGQGHVLDADASPAILVNADDALISENIMMDDQGVKTQAYGLYIFSSARVILIGNISKGNGTDDLREAGVVSYIIQSNNSFSGVIYP
jgi:parallel beta-helix repeat protein